MCSCTRWIDFSASLEASSLPRGSESSDLRQLKRRGRTAACDAASPLPLPLWWTGPVTVWGAGGRPPKVAAMGMSRSWRGGAVLPLGRQDLGHQRRSAPFSARSLSPRGFRPADGAARRDFAAGSCKTPRSPSRVVRVAGSSASSPTNGSLGAVVVLPRFEFVAHILRTS